MLNMNKEEIKQEQNKGLIARMLGGTPTILQKVFFTQVSDLDFKPFEHTL